MVYKNLVFHFYTFEGFRDNEAIKLHLNCLKYYSDIFDNALFVISVDDVNNTELIKETEHAIIDCGFKDVRFKVVENDVYREAKTFKVEIMDKLTSYEGITFFGHTKGVSNMSIKEVNKESVLKWIAGMYFLNLHFVDEAENLLIGQFRTCFYGAYKVISKKVENKNNTWYAGTFFWVNTNRLANNIKQRKIEIPNLHDRGYAEFVTGELDVLGSHGWLYLFPFNYNEAGSRLSFLLDNDEEVVKKYKEYEQEVSV